MAESEYCDDYYEYTNDDCDEDCDNCNHKDCDENPYQKYLHRYSDFVFHENSRSQW